MYWSCLRLCVYNVIKVQTCSLFTVYAKWLLTWDFVKISHNTIKKPPHLYRDPEHSHKARLWEFVSDSSMRREQSSSEQYLAPAQRSIFRSPSLRRNTSHDLSVSDNRTTDLPDSSSAELRRRRRTVGHNAQEERLCIDTAVLLGSIRQLPGKITSKKCEGTLLQECRQIQFPSDIRT